MHCRHVSQYEVRQNRHKPEEKGPQARYHHAMASTHGYAEAMLAGHFGNLPAHDDGCSAWSPATANRKTVPLNRKTPGKARTKTPLRRPCRTATSAPLPGVPGRFRSLATDVIHIAHIARYPRHSGCFRRSRPENFRNQFTGWMLRTIIAANRPRAGRCANTSARRPGQNKEQTWNSTKRSESVTRAGHT